MPPADLVAVGRVVGSHGLRGQLRVHFFGDGPETLEQVDEVWLARSQDDVDATRYALQRARPGRPGEVRVALEGLSRREQADELRSFKDIATLRTIPLERPADAPADYARGAKTAGKLGMGRLARRLEDLAG